MKIVSIFLFLLFNFLLISAQNLQLSNHVGGNVEKEAYAQFYLPQLNEDLKNGEHLVFVLTPLSGSVELYISKDGNATREQHTWKGTHSGSNIQYINNTDPNYTKGPFWISAYGLEKSYFHVIAYLDTQEIVLIEREPQLSHVQPGKYQFFKYYLETNTSFQVSVTPITGDPDVYVKIGGRPSRENSQWRSAAFGIDVLFIENTESEFKYGVTYFFAVYGWTDTLFSIAAAKEGSTEVLTEGIPHGKSVKSSWPHSYAYFEYRLTNHHDLFFEARPAVGGDLPHLCISTEPNPSIEAGTCKWTSYCCDHGKTDIRILKTDPNYKQNAIYYIGLTGHADETSRFVASVTGTTSEKTLLLVQGVSQNHRGTVGTYQFFRFYYGNAEESWALTVTKQFGRVEIYCSNDPTNSQPTKDKYDYKSPDSGSSKIVRLGFRSGRADIGWYYCSTLSVQASNYTIVAATESSQYQLETGQITYASGPPEGYYKYFAYDCRKEVMNGTDITISIHYYSGYGYFYAGVEPRPTISSHKWFGYHTLVIPGKYLAKEKPKAIYVGVYGSSGRRGFLSIVAHTSTSPIQLISGSTSNGIVSDGRYVNYKFSNYHVGRLRAHLTIKNPDGDAMMYAATYPSPDANEHQYATNYFGPKTIIIENPGYSTYYFSVRGISPLNATQYSIRISADYERLATWDYPFTDDVPKDGVRYYQTSVSRFSSKLMVQTTSTDGWTEMYMLPGESQPSRNNFTYRSTSFHGNVIKMTRDSPRWKDGVWTVAVYGREDSDYLISAQTTQGYITLGQPITGGAAANDIAYYRGYVLNGKSYFINAKTFRSDTCIRVYASQDTTRPNKDNAKWIGTSNPLYQNQVLMGIKAEELDNNRWYMYIGVQPCDQSNRTRTFELTTSVGHYPFYVTQESAIVHSQNEYFIEKKPWYVVNANKYSKGFHFYVDSCTNKPISSTVYATTKITAGYPVTPDNKEFESKVVDKRGFTTAIEMTQSLQGKQIKLTLKRNENAAHLFSIFSSLKDKDPRPKCVSFTKTFVRFVPGQEHGKPHPMGEFDFIVGAIESDYYPLTYEFHFAESVNDQSGNFNTPCGIRNSKGDGIFKTVRVDAPKAIELKFAFDARKIHQANLIVRDRYGREMTCEPVQLSTSLSGDIWNATIPLGGFLFTFIAVGISIYLVIGMIVKKVVYKSEGLNLIPNIEFWKDVPALVIDGVIFVFTCGKRSNPHQSVEATPNDSIDNPFDATEVNNESKGYGSI
eukprot:gene2885-4728_t